MTRLTRDHTVDHSYSVLEPALTIEPGETIVVETINHMTPIVRSEADLHPHGSPEYREREETGPIAVRGARPGDMLAVHIEQIEVVGLPHAHGWGPLAGVYPQEPMTFPVEGDRCKLPGGIGVPLAPMIGDIYTMPVTPLPPSDYEAFDHGGNMDFTEIRPGNTLYLPVFHDGGLLVLGDVHAFQGDGEVFGEGGECAADVTLTIDVDRTYCSARPLVETPTELITLAGRGSLWDSLKLAMQDMVSILTRVRGVSEGDAYVFCGMAGSIRIGASMSSRQATEDRCLVGLSVPKGFL